MNNNVNLDLNTTKCLVHQDAIGERIITNICTGEKISIDWTAGNWFEAILGFGLGLFVLSLVVFLIGIACFAVFDHFKYR